MEEENGKVSEIKTVGVIGAGVMGGKNSMFGKGAGVMGVNEQVRVARTRSGRIWRRCDR